MLSTILIALILAGGSWQVVESLHHKKKERRRHGSIVSPSPVLGNPPPPKKLKLGSTSSTSSSPDVLIIGAGVSGLAAARTLLTAEPSLKVLVIEVRPLAKPPRYHASPQRIGLLTHTHPTTT